MTSLVAQPVRSLPAIQETQVQSLGWEDPLEKEMAVHSSILAWTEEPDRLQSWSLKEWDTTERLHLNSNRDFPLVFSFPLGTSELPPWSKATQKNPSINIL